MESLETKPFVNLGQVQVSLAVIALR